jgi:hypothetical protein
LSSTKEETRSRYVPEKCLWTVSCSKLKLVKKLVEFSLNANDPVLQEVIKAVAIPNVRLILLEIESHLIIEEQDE